MRRLTSAVLAAAVALSQVTAQEPPKPKEPTTEQKQQIVIAFQQARIAALEAEKADQAAKALLAEIQAKVCGANGVLTQALVCETAK